MEHYHIDARKDYLPVTYNKFRQLFPNIEKKNIIVFENNDMLHGRGHINLVSMTDDDAIKVRFLDYKDIHKEFFDN